MTTIPYGLFSDLENLMQNMYDDKDTEQFSAFKDRTMRKEINGWQRVYTYSNKTSGFIGYIYEKNGTPVMVAEGTDPKSLTDLITDSALSRGELVGQLTDLEKLYSKTKQMYQGRDYYPATGHSLGGSLVQLLAKNHPDVVAVAFSPYSMGTVSVLRNHPELNKSNGSNIYNFGTETDPIYMPGASLNPGKSFILPKKGFFSNPHMPSSFGSIGDSTQVDPNQDKLIADNFNKQRFARTNCGFVSYQDEINNQRDRQRYSRQRNPQSPDLHNIPQMPSATANSNQFRANTTYEPLPAYIQNQIIEQQKPTTVKISRSGGNFWNKLWNFTVNFVEAIGIQIAIEVAAGFLSDKVSSFVNPNGGYNGGNTSSGNLSSSGVSGYDGGGFPDYDEGTGYHFFRGDSAQNLDIEGIGSISNVGNGYSYFYDSPSGGGSGGIAPSRVGNSLGKNKKLLSGRVDWYK